MLLAALPDCAVGALLATKSAGAGDDPDLKASPEGSPEANREGGSCVEAVARVESVLKATVPQGERCSPATKRETVLGALLAARAALNALEA